MGSKRDPQGEMVECLGLSKQRRVLVPGEPGGAEIAGADTRVCLQGIHLSFLLWIRAFLSLEFLILRQAR